MIVRMEYSFFMFLFSWLCVQYPVESMRNFAGSWHLKKFVAPQILQRVVWSPTSKLGLEHIYARMSMAHIDVDSMSDSMLRNKLRDTEKRISELEARDEPITVREAFSILEAHICLEAVGGSKSKFRNGNHNFDAISKTADPKVTAQLSTILSTRGLSTDHLTMIGYFKEHGDFNLSKPVMMTKDEWREILTGEDLNEALEAAERNDEEEKQLALAAVRITTDLLSVLESYNPAAGGVWEIKHPVVKPLKVPVRKLSASEKVSAT